MTIKPGINRFGRIGRMIFRAAMDHPDVGISVIHDTNDNRRCQSCGSGTAGA